MTKKEKMYARIALHGHQLNTIFESAYDPIELCKRVRRIEGKAHFLALQYCNGDLDWDLVETKIEHCLKSLDKILKFSEKKIPVFINLDPRGYALKIQDDYMADNHLSLCRDWGGYGIIAPDLSL